jgi:hypothetical protein
VATAGQPIAVASVLAAVQVALKAALHLIGSSIPR